MSHTPGPFHVGMKPGPMIYGPKGEQVADLSARMIPDDETADNARLFVAAPDMRAFLDDFCFAMENGGIKRPQGWADRARAIWAKAEGRD